MALKDKWIDRKDGDEIRPEDINDVANAVIDNEKAIADKAPEDHTHALAGTKVEDISLLDLESELTNGAEIVGVDKLNLGERGVAKFLISGHIRFTTKGVYGVYSPIVKVDGKIIDSKEIGEDEDGVVLFAYEFDGNVAESIEFSAVGSSAFVNFETFEKITKKDGFMSAEQAEKLENTPTTEDVQNIVNEAFGIVAQVFDEVHEYAESLGGDEA